MKKIIKLIVVCLMITSCDNAKDNVLFDNPTIPIDDISVDESSGSQDSANRYKSLQEQKLQLQRVSNYKVANLFDELKPLTDKDKIIMRVPNGAVGILGGTIVEFDPKRHYEQSELDTYIGLGYWYIQWAYEQLRLDRYEESTFGHATHDEVLNFVRFYLANIDPNDDYSDNLQIFNNTRRAINLNRVNKVAFYDDVSFGIFRSKPLKDGDTVSLTLPSGTVLTYDVAGDYRLGKLQNIEGKSLIQWTIQIGDLIQTPDCSFYPRNYKYDDNDINALRVLQFALANNEIPIY